MSRWTKLSMAIGALVLAVTGGVVAQDETPEYGQYRVLDVQELDLHAAPANTTALLTPDGAQFAHFGGGEVCIYQLEAGSWAEDRCFELDRDVFRSAPEDVNWSPDGHYLTAPTYRQALMYFVDTDIQVLDTETGAVLNLTDDGFEGGLLSSDRPFNLDIAPVWLDGDTLLFIRYAPDGDADESVMQSLTGATYQINLPSNGAPGDAEHALDLPGDSALWSYLLAADPAGGRVAVNLDEMGDSPLTAAIWQSADGEAFQRLASLGSLPMRYLGYSANGEWLMAIQPDPVKGGAAIALVDAITGKVVTPDLSSADFVEPQLMVAGWAPAGDALAYVVRDDGNPAASGLYIAPGPGEPGHLILPGEFYGTTCCMGNSIRWASNDLIMIGRGAQPGVLLVHVGA